MALSLRSLLILPFVLQVTGITGLVGYLSFRSGQAAVADLAQQLMGETYNRIEHEFDTYLRIARRANQHFEAVLKAEAIAADNLDQLHRYLILENLHTPELTSFVFGTPAGDFRLSNRVLPAARASGITQLRPSDLSYEVAKSDPDEPSRLHFYATDRSGNLQRHLRILDNVDVRQRPWYQQAVTTGQPGWTQPFQIGASPVLTLNTYTPIRAENGDLRGVFAVNLSLDHFDQFLQSLELSPGSAVFAVDQHGLLIASSSQEPAYSVTVAAQRGGQFGTTDFQRLAATDAQDPVIQNVAQYLQTEFGSWEALNSPYRTRINGAGEPLFVQVMPYQDERGLDWSIAIAIPEASFMAAIQRNVQRTIGLCGLALVSSLALGIWTTRQIARPLRALSQATRAYQPGEILPVAASSPVREVDALRQQFARMVAQLNDSFASLHQSEQKFFQLLENLPIGVSIFDAAGKLILLNQHGEQLLGPAPLDEPIADILVTYQCYVAGSDQPYPQEQLPVVRALQGRPTTIDDIEMVLSGQRVPLTITATPLVDADGTLLYAIAIFQDISQQRRAEALQRRYEAELEAQVRAQTVALREREAQLHEAQTLARVGSWELTVATGTSHNSPELNRLLYGDPQYSAASYRELLDLVPLPARQQLQAAIEQAIADGTPYEIEHPIVTSDGSQRWFISRGKALCDASGQVVKIIGTAADLTERQAAERQLRESEAKFATLFYANPAPAWIASLAEGRCLQVNDGFSEFLGYPSAAVLGRSCHELRLWVKASDRQRYMQLLQTAGRLQDFETVFRLSSGEQRTVLLSARVHTLDGQACVLGVLSDITARKQAEVELQRLNDELRRFATTDSLTQVANRRQMQTALEWEWQRCLRDRRPLTLILLDIDYFKAYNDTYGHLQGDTCLQQVAQVLQNCLGRAGDLVARYGGEEFLLILPNTHAEGGLAVAQRLQQAIRDLAIAHQESPFEQRLTVSIGIVTAEVSPNLSARDTLDLADKALYRAKQTRNAYQVEYLRSDEEAV